MFKKNTKVYHIIQGEKIEMNTGLIACRWEGKLAGEENFDLQLGDGDESRAVVRENQVGCLMGCGASSNRPAYVPCVAQPFSNFFLFRKWANWETQVSQAYLRVSPFYAVSRTDTAGVGRIHAT